MKSSLYKIRDCVFEVFRELGAGFLEKLYENALMLELQKQGLNCKAQPIHEAQLLNYLKVLNITLGLLVNFLHPKATVKRYVLS